MEKLKLFYPLAALALLGSAISLHNTHPRPEIFVPRELSNLKINHKVTFFHFGYKRMLSSLIWVETMLNSDHDKYQGADLNSWMYLRFDNMLRLDPKFLKGYQFGAQYLSVVKDDVWGAKSLYDRGLVHYPHDYDLNFNGGFHYYHEVKDIPKAIELYKKIATHKRAPPYLASTVSKFMQTQEGRDIGYDEQQAIMLLVQGYYAADNIMKDFYITKLKEMGIDPAAYGINEVTDNP